MSSKDENSKAPTKRRGSVDSPPAPPAAPARAGAPLSPFGGSLHQTQVVEQTEIMPDEQARRARAAAGSARSSREAPAKTQAIRPEEAKRARDLVKSKLGESPSAQRRKLPPVNAGVLKTAPLAGAPQRPKKTSEAKPPPPGAALTRTLPLAGRQGRAKPPPPAAGGPRATPAEPRARSPCSTGSGRTATAAVAPVALSTARGRGARCGA